MAGADSGAKVLRVKYVGADGSFCNMGEVKLYSDGCRFVALTPEINYLS